MWGIQLSVLKNADADMQVRVSAHLLTSGSSGTSTRATSPTLVEKQFSIGPGGRGAAASGLSEENYGRDDPAAPPICDCEPRGRCVDLLSRMGTTIVKSGRWCGVAVALG